MALAAAQEAVAAEAAKLVALPSRPMSGPHLLVATPGRLMAHLHSTPGFTINGVRFLVVDEADRLLRQDYQGWLPEVLQQIQHKDSSIDLQLPLLQQQAAEDAAAVRLCSAARLPYSSCSSSSSNRLLKLIVSATLTRDPSKLLRLELHNPRYIALTDVHHRYALPQALQQQRVVVPAQHKPLALLGLLHSLAGTTSIVFASSLETTHRCALSGETWSAMQTSVSHGNCMRRAASQDVLLHVLPCHVPCITCKDHHSRASTLLCQEPCC